MEIERKIRQGEIYWLENCKPLDGSEEKRRPVVVIGHVDRQDRKGPVLVAAISSSLSHAKRDTDVIRLPDTQQSPTVRTGLDRPSWLVPRWFLIVEPSRLKRTTGHIKGDLLRRVVVAVEKRVAEL